MIRTSKKQDFQTEFGFKNIPGKTVIFHFSVVFCVIVCTGTYVVTDVGINTDIATKVTLPHFIADTASDKA